MIRQLKRKLSANYAGKDYGKLHLILRCSLQLAIKENGVIYMELGQNSIIL